MIFGLNKKRSEKVIVRIAPSPTGLLHVGTARSALFNFLFARHHGGKFILRIEDTDKERSKEEYEEDILSGLEWLGLKHDEFYRQSERTQVYVSYVKKLIESGAAYISKEEPKEPGGRTEVVRFRNPNRKVKFDDLIRGEVEFDTTELGDFVIAKSPEEPLYHLAVVIDDHESKVTHVIRGEDHISNTPRQILIQEAIGAKRPQYAHMPLILDSERKKLSKRKHGEAVSVNFYKREGFLPEALDNFLAMLGWNPGTEKEIFSLAELVQEFDLKRVQKGGAIFDINKLRHINREHLHRLQTDELYKMIENELGVHDLPEALLSTIAERIEIIGDVSRMKKEGELDYYFSEPQVEIEKLNWKNVDSAETKKHLLKVADMLSNPDAIKKYAEEVGKGNVLWPLRYSLSGRERSPDPFTLISILGIEKARERVLKAANLIENS